LVHLDGTNAMTEVAGRYLGARVEWIGRAAARIRQRDDVVRLSDAADLAAALWRRAPLHDLSPEAAVDRALDGEGVLSLPTQIAGYSEEPAAATPSTDRTP
jgi:hypothetical protein